jgi:fibro-slime domain-containing protein
MTSSTNYGGHGESTTLMTIDPKNTCFYADSSDRVIYEGGQRDGYWGEPFQIRSAEFMKGKDVVDIATGTFTQDANTMYVGTTFYDYYTDYELNGKNRDNYTTGYYASQRTSVTFRQFNQALSEYYQARKTRVPIYVGHFQPEGWDFGIIFQDLKDSLKLYGYMDNQAWGTKTTDQKYFMSVNNSNLDLVPNKSDYNVYAAAQGIVSNSLHNGALRQDNNDRSATVTMPLFDESFLNGNNSKRAKLGEVYHDVKFPFTQVTENNVKYWAFDSSKTTLQMKKDGNTYFLDTLSSPGNRYKNLNYGSVTQSSFGFFPFNDGSTSGNANTYNYGFGSRIDVDFTLSDDGKVEGTDGQMHDMIFKFSGDDDVWVFIDGQLVLDIGGAHGKVTGEINFATSKATVSRVKTSGGSNTSGDNVTKDFTIDKSKTHHTLTMFYMERGMWESNMSIRFNFVPKNAVMPKTTSITATKVWNLDVKTANPVKMQLQRRVGDAAWENVGDPVMLVPGEDNTASHDFENVEQYTDEAQTIAYEFRVVELGNDDKPLI